MANSSELVEVAFVGDEPEAMMIQALLEENEIPSIKQQVTPGGPMLGYGLLNPGGGAQRVMVHADRAERARALIAVASAEGESTLPEPANAEYLADAEGRKPRNYGVVGGYARAYFWSLIGMAAMVGIYFLLRVV